MRVKRRVVMGEGRYAEISMIERRRGRKRETGRSGQNGRRREGHAQGHVLDTEGQG